MVSNVEAVLMVVEYGRGHKFWIIGAEVMLMQDVVQRTMTKFVERSERARNTNILERERKTV